MKEVNDKGHTALHLAAKSGRNQIVALLQEKVGDRCGERERDIERETDTDRQTHRHTETDRNIERERERERESARALLAAKSGRDQVVALLQEKVPPCEAFSYERGTPVHTLGCARKHGKSAPQTRAAATRSSRSSKKRRRPVLLLYYSRA